MPTAASKKKTTTIADLVPDPANCRKHNPRNIGSIVNSLHNVGAARSIVIDEDNVILAGNGLVEAAGEAGIEKVMVVEADGNTVVAVRRTGLTPKQKAELGIADNRTAELADWDAEQLLKTISEHEIELGEIEFTEAELNQLSKGTLLDPNAAGKEYDESIASDVKTCTCPKCGHEFPA
jgi:ParB-like chromosome segregation protein Spo0J